MADTSVTGGKTKGKYKKRVGDKGREFEDEQGNKYNDAQFKEKEGDYTEDAGTQYKEKTSGGGLLSGIRKSYEVIPDKPEAEKPSLGSVAKRRQSDSEEDNKKKKNKYLAGMP
jgi:hypothetical protein